jgi:CBS domain-containing protein
MNTVSEWIHNTTAADIMTHEVACVHPRDRLADAVDLFIRQQITGAPVVDEHGVCVGVLSTTDMLNYEEKREQAPVATRTECRQPYEIWAGIEWWRQFGRVSGPAQPQLDDPVSQYMTRDVVSVTEDTPLIVVLRKMVDAHVHRVLVLDHSRRLKGIISTMDVLSATLRAARREPSELVGSAAEP